MGVNMAEQADSSATTTVPDTCPNCLEVGTVSIITKTIGGVVKYYYQCSSCGYRWPVPAA